MDLFLHLDFKIRRLTLWSNHTKGKANAIARSYYLVFNIPNLPATPSKSKNDVKSRHLSIGSVPISAKT